MNNVEYTSLQDLDRVDLLRLLNTEKVGEHLASHDKFNEDSLEEWIAQKTNVNSTTGCVIKGIKFDDKVAGWCGIQFENGAYELALVLDEEFWWFVGIWLGCPASALPVSLKPPLFPN
ncbi:MAG: hypothetical protein MI867_30105, partial [Pseudomonadales bacterium]|nr:hypothetical protein [Pseudomonadales bacterium]